MSQQLLGSLVSAGKGNLSQLTQAAAAAEQLLQATNITSSVTGDLGAQLVLRAVAAAQSEAAGLQPQALATFARVTGLLLTANVSSPNVISQLASTAQDLGVLAAQLVLAKGSPVLIQAPGLSIVAGSLSPDDTALPVGIPVAASPPQSLWRSLPVGLNTSSSVGFSSVSFTTSNMLGADVAVNPLTCSAGGTCSGTAPAQPLGFAMTLSLSTAQGQVIPVQGLAEPLQLVLPLAVGLSQEQLESRLAVGEVPQCCYLNTSNRAWQGDGCQLKGLRQGPTGPEMLCSCTHLTAFRGFSTWPELPLSDFSDFFEYGTEDLLFCSNVEALFDEAGAQNLISFSWLRRPASAVVWWLSLGSVMVLVGALCMDIFRAVQKRRLRGEEAVTDALLPEPDSCSHVATDFFLPFLSFPAFRDQEVARVIHTVCGSQLGVCADTFKLLARAEKALWEDAALQDQERLRELRVFAASARVQLPEDFSFIATYEGVLDNLALRRWKSFFWMVGPLYPLRRVSCASLPCHYSSRVLLWMNPLLGGIAISCLLCHSLGTDLSVKSSDDCKVKDESQLASRMFWAGVASQLLSTVPAFFMSKVQKHRALANRRPNRAKAVIFYGLGLGLFLLYITYIAAFVANVNDASVGRWMERSFTPVLLQSLLVPIGLAALKLLACVAFLRDRRVVDSVRLGPLRRFAEESDEESPSPEAQAAADLHLPGAVVASPAPDAVSSCSAAAVAKQPTASALPCQQTAAEPVLPVVPTGKLVDRDSASELAEYLDRLEAEVEGRGKQQEEEEEEEVEKLIEEELLARNEGLEPSQEETEQLIAEELAAAEGGC